MPALSNIGTMTPVNLPDIKVTSVVLLRMASNNAGNVWIDTNPNVTAGTDDDTDGVFFAAKDAWEIPVGHLPNRNASDIYCLSDSGTAKLYYIII